MLVEFRERIGIQGLDDTASFLHRYAGVGRDLVEAKCLLKTMVDAGSRYKQLEVALGKGVCMVLPTNIGETK